MGIAIVIAAICYGKLPQETAYRFSDGEPVSTLNRAALLGWALGLQFVFVLLALGLTFFITSATRRMQLAETPANRMLFTVIGNIVTLPQMIIAYAMLDIFLYNIGGKTLLPLWAFTVLVMFAAGVVLATIFARVIAQSRKLKVKK
jgi:hypothetical protein